jgi:hypothetical protein
MRKHDSKLVSAVRAARPAGRSTRVAKPVTVANHVEFGLSMLDPKERDQVQKAYSSWSRLQKLLKNSKPIGPNGIYRLADVSPHLYLVFRVNPNEAEVVDLMNKRTLELMRETGTPRPSECE